ncbi:MAG: indole-3-glycerol phosphate synthase TrpC [Candidatus Sumerlaea chitinivorans]|nr:indole-3-glycerol phosphate synthase TrpC [Candidatus Sumerlaea chitinivorans]
MILDEIVAYKKEFVAHAMRQRPLLELRSAIADLPPAPDFVAALRAKDDIPRVIAEVKKASPSKGVIREQFDPIAIARSYAEHGAAAVSVLTDEAFFQGHLDHLRAVRQALPTMPLLRKDFTIHEYQIYEARASGASAVLLIVSILDKYQLRDFQALAAELGLAALVEVHFEKEADLAAEEGARLLGVNHRDLRTFTVDITRTESILRLLGAERANFTIVAESGIQTPEDVVYFAKLGVDAMLIGEQFMKQPDPGEALVQLCTRSRALVREAKLDSASEDGR